MRELLTASEMREIEQAAMTSGSVTGLELMERAGAGVVEAIVKEWPDFSEQPHSAIVLSGPGNNGGDGYVVARLLAGRGWDVKVFHFGEPARLPPDARTNYEKWKEIGEVEPVSECSEVDDVALVVDALFGIGQTRALPEGLQELAAHLTGTTTKGAVKTVAIDIPSGVHSDTGEAFGEHQFFADLTVTFHSMKPCHVVEEGKKRAGHVVVKDIGL